MKDRVVVRLGTMIVCVLAAASGMAQSTPRVIYAGAGTTLNGTPLYTAAAFSAGSTVETGSNPARLSFGQIEIDMAPSTRFSFTDPAQMGCGTVTITSLEPFSLQVASLSIHNKGAAKYQIVHGNGTVNVSDDSGAVEVTQSGQMTTLTDAQSFSGTGSSDCGGGTDVASNLPDAPGRGHDYKDAELATPSKIAKDLQSPAATGKNYRLDSHVSDWKYWTLTGTMFSSSIAGAELTVRCVEQGKCNRNLYDAPTNRALVYGVGLPTEAGVAYLSYYLKRKNRRWWFVPEALVTAGDTYFIIHSMHWLNR